MLDPEVEGRPWPEQLALDDDAYRSQLGYLFERSQFYRDKLGAAGIGSAGAAGGLADLQSLPLTEKQSCGPPARPKTRSARTSAPTPARSSASTRPAAPPAPPATSR